VSGKGEAVIPRVFVKATKATVAQTALSGLRLFLGKAADPRTGSALRLLGGSACGRGRSGLGLAWELTSELRFGRPEARAGTREAPVAISEGAV